VTAAQQQKQIEALTTGLQKVSEQLAATSPSGGGLEAAAFQRLIPTGEQSGLLTLIAVTESVSLCTPIKC
jgi:hypothetical protein